MRFCRVTEVHGIGSDSAQTESVSFLMATSWPPAPVMDLAVHIHFYSQARVPNKKKKKMIPLEPNPAPHAFHRN